jgi:rubrerythrin
MSDKRDKVPPKKCPICDGKQFTLGYMNEYARNSGFGGFTVGKPGLRASVFGANSTYKTVTWLCNQCGYLISMVDV